LCFVFSEGFPSPSFSFHLPSHFLLRASGWQKALQSPEEKSYHTRSLRHTLRTSVKRLGQQASGLECTIFAEALGGGRWLSQQATPKVVAVRDEPARTSQESRGFEGFLTLSMQNTKKEQNEASRDRMSSTQPAGVARKWKPGMEKGHPLWRASRVCPVWRSSWVSVCTLNKNKPVSHPEMGEGQSLPGLLDICLPLP
jgi:hypothetical protein